MNYLRRLQALPVASQAKRLLSTVPKGKIVNANGDKLLVAGLRGAVIGGSATLDDLAQGKLAFPHPNVGN